MKAIEEIQKLCTPIVKYLKENYNPHCTIIINSDSIKLVTDEINIPNLKQND